MDCYCGFRMNELNFNEAKPAPLTAVLSSFLQKAGMRNAIRLAPLNYFLYSYGADRHSSFKPCSLHSFRLVLRHRNPG